MKSLIIKCIIMVMLALGVSNYLIYIKTGKMPFSFDRFNAPSFSALPDVPKLIGGGKEQAYKWTDENGVTHYSSEPPQELGKQALLLEVDPNTNLIQGAREKDEILPSIAPEPSNTPLPAGSVYNPQNVKKLMDDAKAVQETMNERAKQLEGI